MSKQTCAETVYSRDYTDVKGHLCGATAHATRKIYGKQVPVCRTHDPELKAQRLKARGPTKWERQMAALATDRDNLKRLVVAARNFVDQPGLRTIQDELKQALVPYQRIIA